MKKTIKIESLKVKNFKGIKSLIINFGDVQTKIYGANGTGKTTGFDAFTWLLFDKDHLDNSKFGIKPLDINNKTTDKLDSFVEAVINVDDEKIALSKTLREKWVKRRGAAETEFNGNETIYTWNDVPLKASEFNAKVNEIINEGVFKLVTNPLAFNSLHWEKQREILIDVIGGVDDNSIVKQNKDFSTLLNSLGNKSLEEFQREIKARIKKAKDEIKFIPTRIDEVLNNAPEKLDFEAIKKEIEVNQTKLLKIEEQIKDANKLKEKELKKQSEARIKVIELEAEIKTIEATIKSVAEANYREANVELSKLNVELKQNNEDLGSYKSALLKLESRREIAELDVSVVERKIKDLRAKWATENASTFEFDEDASKCSACDREYEADKIESEKESQLAIFNARKTKRLLSINNEGKELTKELENAKEELKKIEVRIANGIKEIEKLYKNEKGLKIEIKETPEAILSEFIEIEKEKQVSIIKAINEDIAKINDKINNSKDDNDDSLEMDANNIKGIIRELEKRLYAKEQIEQSNKRVAELEKEESNLATVILDLERTEFTIEEFNRAKIEMLESKVNDKFKYVKFSLFEQQVNGGEKETCQSLINGVPFSDANTGSKINAGIDIINTLCSHYNVSAPIFIDNAESVDIIVGLESQYIRLIKNTEDKVLRIETDFDSDSKFEEDLKNAIKSIS